MCEGVVFRHVARRPCVGCMRILPARCIQSVDHREKPRAQRIARLPGHPSRGMATCCRARVRGARARAERGRGRGIVIGALRERVCGELRGCVGTCALRGPDGGGERRGRVCTGGKGAGARGYHARPFLACVCCASGVACSFCAQLFSVAPAARLLSVAPAAPRCCGCRRWLPRRCSEARQRHGRGVGLEAAW